ncbi:Melanopsin-B [Holothuria leucospilota]|uniref:Melanopsin-B n=1 Tax=Holothuria leucospilota TaxID=206669 RepID=A0A9Q1H804_HOLLE|nr:Melanopsin-B [Holothuria leucospilota]
MGVTALDNSFGSHNDTDMHSKNDENLPLAIVMACMFLVAFTSNLLLMCVMLRNPKLRTVPNKLVFNLSLCGLFTVVFNGPFVVITLAKGTWIYSCLMCDLNGFTTTVYGFSAITTLAIISVNRYQLVKLPSERQKVWITPNRLPYVISSVWIFSCLLAVPPLLGWSNYDYVPARAICTLKWSTNRYYTAFIFLLGAALPFIVILVSYFKIFLTVRNSFKNLNSHRRQRRDSIRQQSIFPETTANAVKPAMMPSMTTRTSTGQCQPSITSTIWLKRKNRVRPNDQSFSLPSKKQKIEVGALGNNNSILFANGGDEKEGHMGDKHFDRKAIFERHGDNLTDRFIRENNKLLLLQLERSMGLRKKRLAPIELNETKDGKEQSRKRITNLSTKSRSKIRENKKKKIKNPKLVMKTSRNNASGPREQTGSGSNVLHSETNVHTITSHITANKISAQEDPLYIIDELPVARNAKDATHSDKEYSSREKTDSSHQSSTKSSDNSESKLLTINPKHQNLNRDVRVFTGEMLISNLPSFTPTKLFSSVKQRTSGSTSMRDELRITAMLFLILTSFLICWAPISIVNFIETVSTEPLSQGVNEFSVFMMFFSSVVNPLIYGLLNRNFRNECSSLCHYRCLYNHSSTNNTEGRTRGVKNVFTVVE